MAYVVKYRCQFTDFQNKRNSLIEILKDGYSGDIINLQGAENPFKKQYNKNKHVIGSEVLFKFITTQDELSDLDADFLASAYKNLKLKYYNSGIYAGLFDGSNSYVQVPYDAGNIIDPTVTDWQFEASIYINSDAVGPQITIASIGFAYASASESDIYGITFQMNLAANLIWAKVGKSPAAAATSIFAYTFARNTWYDVKFERTGGNLLFYVNGNLENTNVFADVASGGAYDSHIGARQTIGGTTQWWDGQMKDVKFKELNAPNVEFMDFSLDNTLDNAVPLFPDGTAQGGFSFIDGKEGFRLEFVGWIKPENTDRDEHSKLPTYQISATDGIADLKDVGYATPGFGTIYTDFVSILTTIKRALTLIGIDDIDFFIQCNIYESIQMTSTENLFKEIDHDSRRFFTVKDGETVTMKAYEVLEECVKNFNCRLFQDQGYWKIVNNQEYDSFRITYNWSDLTILDARAANDRTVDINNLNPYDSVWNLNEIAPIKKLRITFRNKDREGNEILNGDFSDGLTGWSNGGWDTFADGGGYLRTVSTNNDTNYFTRTSDFTISAFDEGDLLEIRFRVKLVSITHVSGDFKPSIYPIVVTPSGDTEVGQEVVYEGNWITLTFKHKIEETGAYNVKIYMEPYSDISACEYHWDDIEFVHKLNSKNVAKDSVYIFENDEEGYREEELEVLFGDVVKETDAGALKDGSNLTIAWNRFGKSENEGIIPLLGQQIINDSQAFKNRYTVDIVDSENDIHFGSVLLYKTKRYIFESFDKDSSENKASGDIIEINNADASITTTLQGLTSLDGQSDGSEGGGQAIAATYWLKGANGIYSNNNVGIGMVPTGAYDLEVAGDGYIGGTLNVINNVTAVNFLGEFGDLVSEQNPDAVNAIRVKATGSDVDVVIGDASGYFSVWNAADNNAVFYVNNLGDTDIAGNLTVVGTIINTDFTTLTDNSMADALHRHSELSASDGSPDKVLFISDTGQLDHTGGIARFGTVQGYTYINEDTLNFKWSTDANAEGWINWSGFEGGATQFRDLNIGDGKGNVIAFFDGSTRRVGIWTNTPTVPLDIIASHPQIRIGSSLTNSVLKQGKIVLPHFTTAEKDVMGIFIISDVDSNDVVLGGGSSFQNSATVIRFFTGVNQTTTFGTEKMRIDNIGVGIGTVIPQRNLHIESGVPTIRLSDSNAATDQAVATLIEFYRGNQTNRVGFLGMESSSNDNLILATDYPAGRITLGTGSSVTALTIDSSQRVGIKVTDPDSALEVNGDVHIDGDLFFETDGSGLPSGSMYNDNTATTVTIGTAGTFVRIPSGFTVGQENSITFQNARELAIIKAGRYKIDWSISVALAAGGANDDVEGAIGISNVKNAQGTSHRIIASPTDIGAMGGTAILDLAINQKVALMMTNNSVAANLTVTHASLSLVMVGGT